MKWNRKWWRKPIPHEKPTYPTSRPYKSARSGRRKVLPPKQIDQYYVPLNILEATNNIFHKFAENNAEGYAWWSGYITGSGQAQICTVISPNVKTSFGHIYLNREMLSSMHNKLIELDQILLVELHTHPPGAGGQNPTDANNAAVFYQGFITVVVPNFGLPQFYDFRDSYVYSYVGKDNWRELDRDEIQQKFIIEETIVEVHPVK